MAKKIDTKGFSMRASAHRQQSGNSLKSKKTNVRGSSPDDLIAFLGQLFFKKRTDDKPQ
jgi:hypothetical protein